MSIYLFIIMKFDGIYKNTYENLLLSGTFKHKWSISRVCGTKPT